MARFNCAIATCDRPMFGLGYCNAHYQRLKAGRPLETPIRPNRANGIASMRDAQGRKQCIACREWLPPGNFSAHKATSDRLQVRCRPCIYAARYSLTIADIQAMLVAQDRRCPLCRRDLSERHSVDHDHACCNKPGSCGECVRGLLCHACNHGLGSFHDSVEVLRRAADYIEQHRARLEVIA